MTDELRRFYTHKATGVDISAPRKKVTSWKLVDVYCGQETVLATGDYPLMVWKRKQIGNRKLKIVPN